MLQANRMVLRSLSDRLLIGAPPRPEALPPDTSADAPPPEMSPREAKQMAVAEDDN
jgi:hypothetical protein